jgi:hypothetical protein
VTIHFASIEAGVIGPVTRATMRLSVSQRPQERSSRFCEACARQTRVLVSTVARCVARLCPHDYVVTNRPASASHLQAGCLCA